MICSPSSAHENDYITLEGSVNGLNGLHVVESLCTKRCEDMISRMTLKNGKIHVYLQSGLRITSGDKVRFTPLHHLENWASDPYYSHKREDKGSDSRKVM